VGPGSLEGVIVGLESMGGRRDSKRKKKEEDVQEKGNL